MALLDFDYQLYKVVNKGRDVLPFIQILPIIRENQHKLILKLHTKKSTHLTSGNVWNNLLYDGLIANDALLKNIELFELDERLGIWAPSDCWAPMSQNWRPNQSRVLALGEKFGIEEPEVLRLPFPAGTMFFARTDALLPLLNLGLTEKDFEFERGQLDGTLAHALERAMSFCVICSGFMLPKNALKDSFTFGRNLPSGASLYEKIKRSYRSGGLLQIVIDGVRKIKIFLKVHRNDD